MSSYVGDNCSVRSLFPEPYTADKNRIWIDSKLRVGIECTPIVGTAIGIGAAIVQKFKFEKCAEVRKQSEDKYLNYAHSANELLRSFKALKVSSFLMIVLGLALIAMGAKPCGSAFLAIGAMTLPIACWETYTTQKVVNKINVELHAKQRKQTAQAQILTKINDADFASNPRAFIQKLQGENGAPEGMPRNESVLKFFTEVVLPGLNRETLNAEDVDTFRIQISPFVEKL